MREPLNICSLTLECWARVERHTRGRLAQKVAYFIITRLKNLGKVIFELSLKFTRMTLMAVEYLKVRLISYLAICTLFLYTGTFVYLTNAGYYKRNSHFMSIFY